MFLNIKVPTHNSTSTVREMFSLRRNVKVRNMKDESLNKKQKTCKNISRYKRQRKTKTETETETNLQDDEAGWQAGLAGSG